MYTNEIDWPVYCNAKQYCNTLGDFLECCTSMTTISVTNTQVQTLKSKMRDQGTTTFFTTYYNTGYYNYTLFGCAGYTTCYDYSAKGSCTGDCASNNVVCTDQGWPSCVSLYMTTYSGSATKPVTLAQSWYCDTAAYGLEYDKVGNSPSVTTKYTTTFNQTTPSSAPPTWTPHPVPFTQKQMSMPASGVSAPTPTATSGAPKYGLLRYSSVIGTMILWMLVTLRIT